MRLLVFVNKFIGEIFFKIIEKVPPEFPKILTRNSVFLGHSIRPLFFFSQRPNLAFKKIVFNPNRLTDFSFFNFQRMGLYF